MVVYVIVGGVVLAGLVLAYRTLGGASAGAVDVAAVLRGVLATAVTAAGDLHKLCGAAPLAGPRSPASSNPAKALRRPLSGLQHQLETLDIASQDERTSDAHSLLAVAVDELVWAAGICADDSFGASDGMRAAVAALCDHAARCLQDAARILEPSARAEEVERAP